MPWPTSARVPPRYVEYTSDAAPDLVGSSLVTNASPSHTPVSGFKAQAVWRAPVVVGNGGEVELVCPVT